MNSSYHNWVLKVCKYNGTVSTASVNLSDTVRWRDTYILSENIVFARRLSDMSRTSNTIASAAVTTSDGDQMSHTTKVESEVPPTDGTPATKQHMYTWLDQIYYAYMTKKIMIPRAQLLMQVASQCTVLWIELNQLVKHLLFIISK